MHAKLTRDRKKCFISVLEKTIEDLEAEIGNMRDTLARVSDFRALHDVTSQIVTPSRSPIISPSLSHQETDDEVSAYCVDAQHTPAVQPPVEQQRNDFSLSGWSGPDKTVSTNHLPRSSLLSQTGMLFKMAACESSFHPSLARFHIDVLIRRWIVLPRIIYPTALSSSFDSSSVTKTYFEIKSTTASDKAPSESSNIIMKQITRENNTLMLWAFCLASRATSKLLFDFPHLGYLDSILVTQITFRIAREVEIEDQRSNDEIFSPEFTCFLITSCPCSNCVWLFYRFVVLFIFRSDAQKRCMPG